MAPRLDGDAGDDMLAESNARSTRVLVAIPCFNEAATIGSVVLKARQHADEVVVVDDEFTSVGRFAARRGTRSRVRPRPIGHANSG